MIITTFNVAIVEDDTHLAKWVIEQGRLDVQDDYCRLFQKYIPEGGTVIDVGACIGDHTLSYARMVGPAGTVIAFEPNPTAFACLVHNMKHLHQVRCLEFALGSVPGRGHCDQTDKNLGSNKIFENPQGTVKIATLDTFLRAIHRLDFIKIDAEGFEPEIVLGALATFRRLRPVLLIELNRPLLHERGRTPWDIINLIKSLGYTVQPSEPHHNFSMDHLDALCLP